MQYRFKYGKNHITIPLPEKTQFIKVNPEESKPVKTIFQKEFSNLLKPGATSAAIVVSDKTRICEYDKYLPWLIEVLESKGLNNKTIRFFIAYGTHPGQSDKECLKIYGETYNRFEFVHHKCDSAHLMINLGTTKRGTKVRIRKDVFDHDHLILFGSLTHHYFAGYGGGRKLLFPGMAERESIYSNHKLFIDFNNYRLQPGCMSGNLNGNPVAEDLCEIDSLMPEKIIISGIPGVDGKISRLMIGKTYDDFLSACMVYDRLYRKMNGEKYDNIIASTGGYPKDINFIQSHKSLHNAASFVRDGGNLFLLAECSDGMGNDEFLNILQGHDKQEIFSELRHKYSGNGGTALSLISKTERINVYMLTGLNNEVCNTLNIIRLTERNLRLIAGGLEGSTAVIENASMVYC